jgi:hypothetical protein
MPAHTDSKKKKEEEKKPTSSKGARDVLQNAHSVLVTTPLLDLVDVVVVAVVVEPIVVGRRIEFACVFCASLNSQSVTNEHVVPATARGASASAWRDRESSRGR